MSFHRTAMRWAIGKIKRKPRKTGAVKKIKRRARAGKGGKIGKRMSERQRRIREAAGE